MANYQLASRKFLHHRAKKRTQRHWLSLLGLFAIISTWYVTLGPSPIGGPVTYAVVSGTSMEPQLHTGDLVLTRKQPSYKVGDTVLITVMGGYVVHNIIWQSETELRTKGINNEFDDSWTIPATSILGKQELILPGFGNFLIYLRDNPLSLGVGASLLAVVLLSEPRRRKQSERLVSILQKAEREIPITRPNLINPILTGLFLLSAISLLSTGVLLANRTSFYPRLALSLLGVIVSVIAFEVIGRWLLQGRDLTEPYRTLEIFRKRLYQIDQKVEIPGQTAPVNSADELLKLAELGHTPILHLVLEDGMRHQFFVITDELNYVFDLHVSEQKPAHHGRHKK